MTLYGLHPSLPWAVCTGAEVLVLIAYPMLGVALLREPAWRTARVDNLTAAAPGSSEPQLPQPQPQTKGGSETHVEAFVPESQEGTQPAESKALEVVEVADG